jgi:hypothetical protein
MDLTSMFVRDARRLIDDTDDADYTDPDLPHRKAVRLIVRLVEMLRTMANHADRLQGSVDTLRAENQALRQEANRLQVELATRDDVPAAA